MQMHDYIIVGMKYLIWTLLKRPSLITKVNTKHKNKNKHKCLIVHLEYLSSMTKADNQKAKS